MSRIYRPYFGSTPVVKKEPDTTQEVIKNILEEPVKETKTASKKKEDK